MLNLKEMTREQLSEQQTALTERYRALCQEGNHLLLTFKSRDFHLAVKSHRSPLENQDKTYNQRKRQ